MSQEWLNANLKKFEFEESQELDSLTAKIRYSAIGAFIVALFPQFYLMTMLERKYPVKSFKVRACSGALILIPFISANLASMPFEFMQMQLIEKLKVKYSASEGN